ncbi:MAG TPA: uroporphyrinogen-III synthase [Candidatus Sulfotelmatobacter sp.]|nr:uroporphyrinogen-III synthase [Candidatus Sulfotelmatobacter sp.]
MVQATTAGFAGRTVLAFESRRAPEIARLIENYGGRAIVAPATKEVPATDSTDLPRFVAALLDGKLDLVIFLTGVGTRALARAIEPFCSREQFVSGLSKTSILARGPKPVSALKELGVPITWTVPEPNTWREILETIDGNKVSLAGRTVAVQEHGIPSPQLIEGLQKRGAHTLTVHVYDWALPDDLSPLTDALKVLQENGAGVVLFTAAVQVHHLMRVAEQQGARESVVAALNRTTVASIGPVTSEALAEYGVTIHMEPTHPKMGFLVKEASEQV